VTRSKSIEGRPIFLIGFMGSGKSTVGRLLADRLGRPFVDADQRIESVSRATIAELFQRGEAHFRAREAEVIRALCDEGAQVIAAGGGAPAHGDNLERMLQAGVVIGLHASPERILERVGDASTRPLLAGAADKRAEVERLLSARAPAYARAHFTVDTDGQAPSQVVTQIVEALAC
jgi:shikimate kinase